MEKLDNKKIMIKISDQCNARHMSSTEFANTKQEELASGPLTKVEFFVLENILAFCCQEDIDATPDNMSKVYDRVLAFIQQTDPTIHLSKMSKQRIENFLSLHQKCFAIFKILCDMQLDWNIEKKYKQDKHGTNEGLISDHVVLRYMNYILHLVNECNNCLACSGSTPPPTALSIKSLFPSITSITLLPPLPI